MARNKTRIFVEATPLLDKYMSGIGHLTLRLVEALCGPKYRSEVDIILVAPFDKMHLLKQRTGHLPVRHKAIPLPAKVLYGLWKFNVIPPLDLWLGKGVYFFPNYRNWRLARSKSITYVHDLSFKEVPHTVSPANQQFLVRHMPAWLRHTDRVAALSKNTWAAVEREYHVPKRDISLVYAGIDLDLFYPRDDKEAVDVRKKYNVPAKYFMFLSTIEPRKSVDVLLDAYEALPQKTRDTYALLLVGASGWLNEKIVARVKAMQAKGDQVIWPQTFVPDEELPALLSGATLLIHPAMYEGFGITPLEAMACRTPVIVANNTSLPEVVGDTGVYFKTGDASDLRQKITTMLDSPQKRRALAQKGYDRAQQFTWGHAATQFMKCVHKLQEDRE